MSTIGTISYEIWKKMSDDSNWYEVNLFTDANITDEILEDFGPYQFLNIPAFDPISNLGHLDLQLGHLNLRQYIPAMPSLVLRINNSFWNQHFNCDNDTLDTNDLYYHGGLLQDEIAAITSLILGIRVKSGGVTRIFDTGDRDKRGRPFHDFMNKDPILIKGDKCIIPGAYKTVNIKKDLVKLLSYPILKPDDAIILVKAARIYQEAMWIAESQPETSWILFASAIETVANYWNKSDKSDIDNEELWIKKLANKNSNLVTKLEEKGGIELVKDVAKQVGPYLGATNKFIKFVLKFLPSKPNIRPKHGEFPWSKSKIEDALDIIYDHRSNFLHSGKQFPAPMCWPPIMMGDHLAEKPCGLAFATKGGKWNEKDVPMLLHTFEYITRGALLGWWGSLINS